MTHTTTDGVVPAYRNTRRGRMRIQRLVEAWLWEFVRVVDPGSFRKSTVW